MRITFLCGSFEPGRDGVGDYVAQLARALTSLGHAVQVIALADGHARVQSLSIADGFEIVRVPAALWRAGDLAAAAAHVRRFAPDWVSLQMVSYAYEERGLLVRSSRRFREFAAGARRHVMLHELWIGEDAACSPRERLVGTAQRLLLVRALRRWAAHVSHTSNPTYRELLARSGVKAELLPLPGNVPLVAVSPQRARQVLVARTGLVGSVFLAGVFGAVHHAWSQGSWLDALAAASAARGAPLALVQLGRAGTAGADAWRALRVRHRDRVRFAELGELAAPELSVMLQGLDLGVAATPWALVGKSGAVAAMLEHGLPVVVTRTEYRLRRGTAPEPVGEAGLHRFGDEFLALLGRGELERRPPRARQDVYRDFLASLAAHGPVPAAAVAQVPA